TPDNDLDHFDVPQSETFTYQLVHPVTGAIEEGSLNVTVEPQGAGTEPFDAGIEATTFNVFDEDVVSLRSFDGDDEGGHAPKITHLSVEDLVTEADTTDDWVQLDGL